MNKTDNYSPEEWAKYLEDRCLSLEDEVESLRQKCKEYEAKITRCMEINKQEIKQNIRLRSEIIPLTSRSLDLMKSNLVSREKLEHLRSEVDLLERNELNLFEVSA